jgi:leader peptidase (prepilin peptidase)/N-methyltransferase
LDTPYIVLFAVLGLCVGSFLNVLIVRVPVKESIVAPGSRCPHCRTPLRPRDNIPVLSWVRLRGRCRTCATPISVQYPIVELLSAALWAWAAHQFRHAWVVIAVVLLLSALVALSVIDLQTFRLPDRITFPTLWAAIVVTSVASYSVTHDLGAAWDIEKYALLGMVMYFGILLVTHLISPRGMGFGDVKLSLVLGLYLGWVLAPSADQPLPVLLIAGGVFRALIIGCVLGLVFGLTWQFLAPGRDPLDQVTDGDVSSAGEDPAPLAVHDVDVAAPPKSLRKRAFPFGPALAVGTALVVLLPSLRP